MTEGHHFLIDVRILACRVDSICCIEPIIVRYMYMYIEDIQLYEVNMTKVRISFYYTYIQF